MQNYTRRQLKKGDKFSETAQGAVHWASEHRQKIIWGVALLVIAGIAIIGYLAWNSRQTEKANIALGAAMQTFAAPLRPAGIQATPNDTTKSFSSIAERGKQAEKEFKAIADQFSHTSPGKIARYMAGAAALQAGDNAAAEQQLKAAADSSDKDVAALAKMALANLYLTTNKQSEAAKIYKDLSDHPTDTVSKGQAQLALADMYEATDPKQAAALYEQIQKEDPKSPAAEIAASKLGNGGK